MKGRFPIPSFCANKLEFTRDLLDELERTGYNYYVYILKCNNGEYYVGITNDLDSRLWEHDTGVNPKCFTYDKRPLKLEYFELYHNIRTAIDREKQLKGWSKKKKEALINRKYDELHFLAMRKKKK